MGSNVAAAKDLPDLRFSPIVLVDDTGRFRQGEDRTITLGEPVLDLALALQSGASVTPDALARRPAWVPATNLLRLREATPAADDPRARNGAKVYCTLRFAISKDVQRSQQATGIDLPEGENLQACFVDGDTDGLFETVFALGTEDEDFALPSSIDPLAYRTQTNVPMGDLRWRLVAKQEDRTRSLGALGLLSQRQVFQAQTNGATGRYDEAQTGLIGSACGQTTIPIDTGFKTSRLPRTYSFGCAEIAVTDYDKRTRTLTYRIVKPMPEQPVSLKVSFLDIYGGTIYTLD